jgi:hypothetical protein
MNLSKCESLQVSAALGYTMSKQEYPKSQSSVRFLTPQFPKGTTGLIPCPAAPDPYPVSPKLSNAAFARCAPCSTWPATLAMSRDLSPIQTDRFDLLPIELSATIPTKAGQSGTARSSRPSIRPKPRSATSHAMCLIPNPLQFRGCCTCLRETLGCSRSQLGIFHDER